MSQSFTPRPSIFGTRDPIMQPLPDRLLTEDRFFLITEDGYYIQLEANGQ
jgi:hypothetical protein